MVISTLKFIFLFIIIKPAILEEVALPNADAAIENDCRQLESFFGELRKDLFEPTKNPFKYLLTIVSRGNEFGKVNISLVQSQFNELLTDFGINTDHLETELAVALASQFKDMPFCMEISDAATFIFRLLKFDFVKENKSVFLRTLLRETSPAFQIRFILYTLENLMECNEELTESLLSTYYDNQTDFINEFVSLYETVLNLHSQNSKSQWQLTYTKSIDLALSQGKAFLTIFLLYQFKGLFASEFSDYMNFFIDHFVLCKISAFLVSVIQDLKISKQKSLIVDLSNFFVNMHDQQLKSKNILELENIITANNKAVEDCPQCIAKLATKKLQKEGALIKI